MNIKESVNLVTLVDNNGNTIGYADKIEAHLRGDLHLAFSLMIIRRQGDYAEYLLQRRAADKYHSGGLWANTCCSHPLPRETVKDAARRRVAEELGIKAKLSLSTIGQICYRHTLDNNMIEHEFDTIVVAEVDNVEWQQNPDEVMEARWWTEHEIIKALKYNPKVFTAWFEEVFNYIRDERLLSIPKL
jgi:isopentenyl-diphosphate delta-isomerase